MLRVCMLVVQLALKVGESDSFRINGRFSEVEREWVLYILF